MRDILLIGTAREKSTRVSNKMIRPFGDTTLFEIYLKKLEQISTMPNPFNDIIMSISRADETLWEMCRDSKIKIVPRSLFSVSDKATTTSSVYHFLKDFKEDYVMHVNGCFPFLKPETIVEIAKTFKVRDDKSLMCVKKRFNYFFNAKNHKPINNKDPRCLCTKAIPPVLEGVLSVIIYDRKFMLENDYYWDYTKNNPYLYILPDSIECLDIDTQTEFDVCQELWNKKEK